MNRIDTTVMNMPNGTLPPVFGWFLANTRRMAILMAFAFVLGLSSYFCVDRLLAQWVDTLNIPANQFWQLVTRLGLSEWYLVSAGLLLFVFTLVTKDPWPAWRSALLVCCVGGSGLFVNLLKWIFGRYRPPMLLKEDLFGFSFFGKGYMLHSFPSGHSATAASLVVVACYLMPRFKWLWLVLGLLIAISRIFVGAHYPSDVIAGWTVGLIFSVMVCNKLKSPEHESLKA